MATNSHGQVIRAARRCPEEAPDYNPNDIPAVQSQRANDILRRPRIRTKHEDGIMSSLDHVEEYSIQARLVPPCDVGALVRDPISTHRFGFCDLIDYDWAPVVDVATG